MPTKASHRALELAHTANLRAGCWLTRASVRWTADLGAVSASRPPRTEGPRLHCVSRAHQWQSFLHGEDDPLNVDVHGLVVVGFRNAATRPNGRFEGAMQCRLAGSDPLRRRDVEPDDPDDRSSHARLRLNSGGKATKLHRQRGVHRTPSQLLTEGFAFHLGQVEHRTFELLSDLRSARLPG